MLTNSSSGLLFSCVLLLSRTLVFQKKELAASLIRLVGVLLDSPDGFASDMTKVLECIFVKALIWSVGSCVDRNGRKLFGNYLRMIMEDRGLEESEAHQDFLLKNRLWVARDRPITLLPPDDGRLLYDFRFDAKKGQWQPWLETVSCTTVFQGDMPLPGGGKPKSSKGIHHI